jgi:hypothetical protein
VRWASLDEVAGLTTTPGLIETLREAFSRIRSGGQARNLVEAGPAHGKRLRPGCRLDSAPEGGVGMDHVMVADAAGLVPQDGLIETLREAFSRIRSAAEGLAEGLA